MLKGDESQPSLQPQGKLPPGNHSELDMIPVRTGVPLGGLASSDSLTSLASRSAAILSIGAVSTQIGLAGEPEPRWIIPTEFHHPDTPQQIYTYLGILDLLKNTETYAFGVDAVSAFVEQLFLRFLLANPDSMRVVILESMTCPMKFKQALSEVLFRRFKVRKLLRTNWHHPYESG